MITSYQPRLSLLVIAIVFLLLLPIVNCTSEQMQMTPMENRIRTAAIKNSFHGILQPGKSNEDYKEEMKHRIEDYLKIYPYRRASSFQAMRGKRSVDTA